MQDPKQIKRLKLVAIVLAVGVGFVTRTQTTAGAQAQPARLFEFAGISMPLEQRVGVDDGAAFVVHFAGDTRGALDTCG